MNRSDLIIQVIEREQGKCWVKDCPNRARDVHEAIVTRGDVQGWKLAKRSEIFHPYNCIALCAQHHNTDLEPKSDVVYRWMVDRYGDGVRVWFENLAKEFKVVPGRLKGVIR